MMIRKTLFVLAMLFLCTRQVFGQDTLNVTCPTFRIGTGISLSRPIYGPNLYFYYRSISLETVYGLPTSSREKSNIITETQSGFRTNLSITIASLTNSRKLSGHNFYYPIVLGFGYSYAKEKNIVKGYQGNGKIIGTHYFLGYQGLWTESKFTKHFGTAIYIGYSKWNFKNSILEKEHTGIKYNYGNMDLYMSIFYFLK